LNFVSVNHLSDGVTISRLLKHLLDGFDPAARLLRFFWRERHFPSTTNIVSRGRTIGTPRPAKGVFNHA